MPVEQTPSAPVPVRRMRRRRSGRLYLYYSAIFCGLVLLSIPLGHEYYVRAQRSRVMEATAGALAGKAQPQTAAEAPAARDFDLVLSEVAFREDAGKRYVAGVLKNDSKRAYRNIQILLLLRTAAGVVTGTVPVEIQELKAETAIEFRSPQLPEDTARFSVRDLSGTPQ